METKKEVKKTNWMEDLVDAFDFNEKEIKFLIVGILSIFHDKGSDINAKK